MLEIGEGKLFWVLSLHPSLDHGCVDVSRVVATVKVSGSEHSVSVEEGSRRQQGTEGSESSEIDEEQGQQRRHRGRKGKAVNHRRKCRNTR